MVLVQPWVLAVWAVVALLVYLWLRFGGKLRRKPHVKPSAQLPVAHVERLSALPGYAAAARRYRLLLRIAAGSTALLVAVALLLTLRPANQDLVASAQKNRDILLCLDISGSMLPVDKTVFQKFSELAGKFEGQRIGLTVFNSTASTVFPLTDDYSLIKEQLELGALAFSVDKPASEPIDSEVYKAYQSIRAGTHGISGSASLIGTSLATCVKRLGDNETHRSQSIILATDNEANGREIITTPQAMALAKQKGIRVYALDPAKDYADVQDGPHAELRSSTVSTGGAYFALDSPAAIPSVIDSISKQEASLLTGPPEIAQSDVSTPFVAVAFLAVVALAFVAWRLRI